MLQDYQKQLIDRVCPEKLKFDFNTVKEVKGIQFLYLNKDFPEVHCLIPLSVDLRQSGNSGLLHSFMSNYLTPSKQQIHL